MTGHHPIQLSSCHQYRVYLYSGINYSVTATTLHVCNYKRFCCRYANTYIRTSTSILVYESILVYWYTLTSVYPLLYIQ